MKDPFTEKQKVEIAYFEANVRTWLKNPLFVNKYALIYGKEMVGIYDTFSSAFGAAEPKYRRGDYIIQQIVDPEARVHFVWPAIVATVPAMA